MKKFFPVLLLLTVFSSCIFNQKNAKLCRSVLKEENDWAKLLKSQKAFFKQAEILKAKAEKSEYRLSFKEVMDNYQAYLSFIEKRFLAVAKLKKYYDAFEKKCSQQVFVNRHMEILSYYLYWQNLVDTVKEERDMYRKAELRRLAILQKNKKQRVKVRALQEACQGKAEKSVECQSFLKKLNGYCSAYRNISDCDKDSYCFFKYHGVGSMTCFPLYYLEKEASFLQSEEARRVAAAVQACRQNRRLRDCRFLVLQAEKYCQHFSFRRNCRSQPICRWEGEFGQKAGCFSKGRLVILYGNF